ncbi:hypothetical protein BJX62DRAFT_196716 [Aspergillus germanicus]
MPNALVSTASMTGVLSCNQYRQGSQFRTFHVEQRLPRHWKRSNLLTISMAIGYKYCLPPEDRKCPRPSLLEKCAIS